MDTYWASLTDVFGWVVQTSLYAVVVIAVIAAVQMLGRRHLPVKWSYALWLILLVRLILPSGLESGLSLWNFLPQFTFRESKIPSAENGLALLYPSGPDDSLSETEFGNAGLPANGAITEKDRDAAVRPTQKTDPGSASILHKAWKLAPGVWLAGVLCLMIVIAISNFRLWNSVRKMRLVTDRSLLELLEDCKQQMQVRTVVGLALSSRIKSPTLFGFIRPRVLLPASMIQHVGREELRCIFLHELAHLKRGDIWVGWMVALLQSLHWFNPAVWWAFARMRSDRELACDAAVLSRVQAVESGRYGGVLVHLLEHFSHAQSLPSIAGILENKAQLKRRITMISHFKRPPRGTAVLAAALLTILSVGLLTDAKHNAIAGVAVSSQTQTPQSEQRQVLRFSYVLPQGQQFSDPDFRSVLAVSPDGTLFVYSTPTGLYLRSASELNALRIPGTENNPAEPFFSPDGKWIGYFSTEDHMLKKIYRGGGALLTLADVSEIADASWNEDNTILYSQRGKGIMRISANGGIPETIVKAENGAILLSPQILPDGKSILYIHVSDQSSQIMVQSLESGERKVLLLGGDNGRYLTSGHIVYSLNNNLFAVPFDLVKLEITGAPVSVVEGILGEFGNQYAVSNSGTLVYIPKGEAGDSPEGTLVWVDRQGKEESLGVPPNEFGTPRISPDGTMAAMSVTNSGNTDIWIWNLKYQTMVRLTFDNAEDSCPLWTPDERKIVFRRKGDVYWKAADGTGPVELLCSVPDKIITPYSWSPDGKTLMLTQTDLTGNRNADIGILYVEDGRQWRALFQEKYNESEPRISPDGRFIAYVSDESGRNEIFVRPFPDVMKGKWQASGGGGSDPVWSPDGRELFYRNGLEAIAVPVETERTLRLGRPEMLFQGPYLKQWDVTPDGKRFLMIRSPGGAEAAADRRTINIVTNWLEELKIRVPVP